MRTRYLIALVAFAMALSTSGLAASHPHPKQHGPDTGHLLGPGAWGNIEHLSTERVTNTPGLVADVTVNTARTHAFLANWGRPTCAANSEAGGRRDPDAGAWVIDITDLSNPRTVGFIPHHQDSRPGEGMQVVDMSTRFFTGDMLVMNSEQCGKNGKGGIVLWDVSDPTRPKRLSSHFGDRGFADVNDIHSAFAWDAGDAAYAVMVDNFEFSDVDILDITNPRRPRLIAEYNLNTFVPGGVDQPEIHLLESFLHDMIVKEIDGRFIMLLSYWDGGFVKLDVTDPRNAVYLGDTDYLNPDPLLLERTGVALPPEGNAHQAEFTIDNRYFIGTDEDFSPYRSIFEITTGPNAGEYPAGEFGWTVPVASLPDQALNGPTVYGGYGCPQSAHLIPPASVLDGMVGPGEDRILVLQRGPVGDPSANYGACFFSEKVEAAQNAGYDGVLIANHHIGAGGSHEGGHATICGSMGHVFTPTIPALCVGHETLHLLFNSPPDFSVPYVPSREPAIGSIGERVNAEAMFDGWGYVHLFDANTLEELDQYAIPEAHDEAFATGFGDLTVHEVAVDPDDADRAYLSYYAGGIRALQIVNDQLVETGGYLDPNGNDFWGVETFVDPATGDTIILGSDRDSGLWIFRQIP